MIYKFRYYESKLFAILLLTVLISTQQGQTRTQQPGSCSALIENFIQSHINSDYKKLGQILSDDACYKIPRQNKVIVQSKTVLLAAMRKESGIKQNCTSSSEILTKTDALVLARIDFKYPEFTQQNFLTIEKDDDNNWKISQVCKIFNSDTAS